jgi:dienelactone hydrolase
LGAEEKARGIDAKMRLTARLLETEQLEDVRAAVDYVRTRPDVDLSRVAVFGSAFGGMLSVLAAERIPHIKASICVHRGTRLGERRNPRSAAAAVRKALGP